MKMHAKRTTQASRLAAALLALALCLAAILAVQPLARLVGWHAWVADSGAASSSEALAARVAAPSGQAGSRSSLADGSFGFADATENLPLALFAYVSGSEPLQAGVPDSFASEVVEASHLGARQQVHAGSTVGIVCDLPSDEVVRRLSQELEQNGWARLGQEDAASASGPWQASYAKAGGMFRWLHVALYSLGGGVTGGATMGGSAVDGAVADDVPRGNAGTGGSTTGEATTSGATTCVFQTGGGIAQ